MNDSDYYNIRMVGPRNNGSRNPKIFYLRWIECKLFYPGSTSIQICGPGEIGNSGCEKFVLKIFGRDIFIHGLQRFFTELNDLSRPFRHWTTQIKNNLFTRRDSF